MSASILDPWSKAFTALGLAPSLQMQPSGEEEGWWLIASRFTTHGFFLLWIHPAKAVMRADLTLPGPPERGAKTLDALLESSAHVAPEFDLSLLVKGPPSIVLITLPGPSDPALDSLQTLLAMWLQLTDHLQTLESDPEAPAPFGPDTPEQDDTQGEDENQEAAQPNERPAKDNPAPHVEPIGPQEHSPQHQADPPPTSDSKTQGPQTPHGAFEVLGPKAKEDEKDEKDEKDEVVLRTFELTPHPAHIQLRLGFSGPPKEDLLLLLARDLSIRLDLNLLDTHLHGDHDATMTLRPGLTTATAEDVATDLKSLQRTLERILSWQELGTPLRQILGDSPRGTTSGSTPAQRAKKSTAGKPEGLPPSAAPPSGQQPESDSEQVVLALGGPAPGTGELQPGRFDDPRLRAPEATTQLVDVVLRHPGFSERRIGQVLSILLSVNYSQALELAAQAPCVIAWGMGRERAMTFKNVIEGAGGKALLVEPNTF